jgi:hypothetical protein
MPHQPQQQHPCLSAAARSAWKGGGGVHGTRQSNKVFKVHAEVLAGTTDSVQYSYTREMLVQVAVAGGGWLTTKCQMNSEGCASPCNMPESCCTVAAREPRLGCPRRSP